MVLWEKESVWACHTKISKGLNRLPQNLKSTCSFPAIQYYASSIAVGAVISKFPLFHRHFYCFNNGVMTRNDRSLLLLSFRGQMIQIKIHFNIYSLFYKRKAKKKNTENEYLWLSICVRIKCHLMQCFYFIWGIQLKKKINLLISL